MAIPFLNDANQLAALAGLFNQQVENASYTNPSGITVSFHVLNKQQIPAERYIAGQINTYDLIAGASEKDGNIGLFNTDLFSQNIQEEITRKYVLNRVPYANYDVPVDLGTGSQKIVFTVIFTGTMYQTAWHNLISALFNNQVKGLGVLLHPFYGEIKNVLPVKVSNAFTYDKLNCVSHEITFLTSDISHLTSNINTTSTLAEIGKWYTGIQNSVTSINGTISAIGALTNNLL